MSFLLSKMWIWSFRNLKIPLEFYNSLDGIRCLSNKSAYITKVRRSRFLRLYPTLVVQPDGSTYFVRHIEPRKIIKLPLDISKVSEELRKEILEKRKPKKKVIIEEEIEDDFDSSQYVQLIQKQKSSG